VRVTALYIHPVKSLRAISVDEAEVVRGGFRFDRRWMIVRADGTFITQRTHPRLALVDTRISDRLYLQSPDAGAIELPLEHDASPMDVVCWKDTVRAMRFAAADEWATRVAAEPAHLVYMAGEDLRTATVADGVSFADAYPFLLTSLASLADLNERLSKKVEMTRFRPNIVIDGTHPWVEEELGAFRIGDVEFETTKACSRCVVTTIDPSTAEKSAEPLATLVYRQRENKVYFGMNLVAKSGGVIRVGDVLR
jgi:hypothetical protein